MHLIPNLFLDCSALHRFFIIFVACNSLFMHRRIFEKIKIVFHWIKNHKYIFVTLVFLAIILVIDDNNMIGHIRNRTTINRLKNEIESMETDSAFVQNKLDQFMGDDVEVFEDEARNRGWLKSDEEAFIIKK